MTRDIMKVCNECKCSIPQKRIDLGFSVCVKCSDVESYGFVNIINHKTGNTVQPLPRAQAQAINKVGDRKRFGTVLKGGNKSTAYNPKNTKHKVPTSFIGSDAGFDIVGKNALEFIELKGTEYALEYILKEVRNYTISEAQAFKMRKLLNVLHV